MFAGTGVTAGAVPQPSGSSEVNALAVSLTGQWDVIELWQDAGYIKPTWTIAQDQASIMITSDSGDVANGIKLGELVAFKFEDGCDPAYFGNVVQADYMWGFGKCTDGSDDSVVWVATLIPD